jgi:hypothetical protein
MHRGATLVNLVAALFGNIGHCIMLDILRAKKMKPGFSLTPIAL